MAAPGEWHPERYRDLLCVLRFWDATPRR